MQSVNVRKQWKIIYFNFPASKVKYLSVLFCLYRSLKPKDIQFTSKEDKENQQILIFDKL